MLRVALHERGDVTAAVYTGTSLGVNTFRSPPQCCPPQDALGGGGRALSLQSHLTVSRGCSCRFGF